MATVATLSGELTNEWFQAPCARPRRRLREIANPEMLTRRAPTNRNTCNHGEGFGYMIFPKFHAVNASNSARAAMEPWIMTWTSLSRRCIERPATVDGADPES